MKLTPLTIDQTIALLLEARQRIGGDKTLWVNAKGKQSKWDEIAVTQVTPTDDGESVYAILTAHPEADLINLDPPDDEE